jgi:hypothetical protein
MKNRTTKVKFPVFNGYEVRVILSHDVRATSRRLGAGSDPCVACFIKGGEGDRHGWLVLAQDPDEGTIAHEASHAVQELFRWAGARRDEETYAYHLDYLVGRIHKFVKRGKS